MNPLIKELASKALKQPDTDNDGLTVFDNDELKKFAELIVRECLETIETSTTLQLPKRDIDKIYTIVKQHFGVEEC